MMPAGIFVEASVTKFVAGFGRCLTSSQTIILIKDLLFGSFYFQTSYSSGDGLFTLKNCKNAPVPTQ